MTALEIAQMLAGKLLAPDTGRAKLQLVSDTAFPVTETGGMAVVEFTLVGNPRRRFTVCGLLFLITVLKYNNLT